MNYMRITSAPAPRTSETGIVGTTLLVKLGTRTKQFMCGLRPGGHDALLHYSGNRISMLCSSCGHETPGWEISGGRPRRK